MTRGKQTIVAVAFISGLFAALYVYSLFPAKDNEANPLKYIPMDKRRPRNSNIIRACVVVNPSVDSSHISDISLTGAIREDVLRLWGERLEVVVEDVITTNELLGVMARTSCGPKYDYFSYDLSEFMGLNHLDENVFTVAAELSEVYASDIQGMPTASLDEVLKCINMDVSKRDSYSSDSDLILREIAMRHARGMYSVLSSMRSDGTKYVSDHPLFIETLWKCFASTHDYDLIITNEPILVIEKRTGQSLHVGYRGGAVSGISMNEEGKIIISSFASRNIGTIARVYSHEYGHMKYGYRDELSHRGCIMRPRICETEEEWVNSSKVLCAETHPVDGRIP